MVADAVLEYFVHKKTEIQIKICINHYSESVS